MLRMPNSISTAATGARIVGRGRETAAGPGPDIMAASTLDSDRVFSSDGEEVGKIREIMLDVREGRIAYAVMASGGFLGIGNELFAIPWSALTLDTTRKCFVLDVSSERVKEASGFDQDNWPAMADSSWATTLNEYYGTRVHWEDERVAQTGPAQSPEPPEAGGVKL
jgi:sporulation protein YlmC with PRC-barrel domain